MNLVKKLMTISTDDLSKEEIAALQHFVSSLQNRNTACDIGGPKCDSHE